MRTILTISLLAIVISCLADGVQPSGSGTSYSPWVVYELDHLLWISTHPGMWDDIFAQTYNIDASDTATWNNGEGFSPIGNSTTPFTGEWDGDGWAISGLVINRPNTNEQALFGYVEGATIKNLGVTNCSITGDTRVAAIAASFRSSSLMRNCQASGTISGSQNVGGLVGFNRYSSTIENSFNLAGVDGTISAGGIAGKSNDGSAILNCYNLGDITGSIDIAGIVSLNSASLVQNCYNAGFVSGTNGGLVCTIESGGAVLNSVWDIETSQCPNSMGGIPSTTTQMREIDIYLGLGWDFQDETDNGTDDIWGIHFSNHDGYPFLSWQNIAHIPATGTAPSGTGTDVDPYLISDVNHLAWISTHPDSWDKHFLMTGDIDASDTANWYDGDGLLPFCTETEPFTGFWDGGDFAIDGLTIDRSNRENVGLFAYADGVTIQNLNLTGADIRGDDYTGGICGRTNNCTITSCSFSGVIHGRLYTGGITGYDMRSTIQGCEVDGDITGRSHVGGIIGKTFRTTLSDCHADCNVTANIEMGGVFAGWIDYMSHVSDSHAEGTLSATSYAGGFVGLMQGPSDITRCSAKVDVTGGDDEFYGGFAGKLSSQCLVTDSYCIGTLDAIGEKKGGFTGEAYFQSEIIRSYAVVDIMNQTNGPKAFVKTVDNSTFTDCLYDQTVAGAITDNYATGYSTELMTIWMPYAFHGFDFPDEELNGTDDTWGVNPSENGGYPFLMIEGLANQNAFLSQPGGDGSQGTPWLIADMPTLAWIGHNPSSWSDWFEQTADIDATTSATYQLGAGLPIIGTADTPFQGNYNGMDRTISSLAWTAPDEDAGLFGTAENATITGVNLTDFEITSAVNLAGGICGFATGTAISSCSASGTISAALHCGMIAGLVENSTITSCNVSGAIVNGDEAGSVVGKATGSTITGCTAEGDITGVTRSGGFAGWITGTTLVHLSSFSGTVQGTGQVGGFVGYGAASSTIEECFAIVDVVTGTASETGGFAGALESPFTIADCFVQGSIEVSTLNSGGFLGGATGTCSLQRCYSAVASGSVALGGGFSGIVGSTAIQDCFWDTDLVPGTGEANATGLPTQTMQTATPYTDAGWDWMEESANGDQDMWGINLQDNGGYPFLSWQGYDNLLYLIEAPSGAGTTASPYIIATLANLGWLSMNSEAWDDVFLMTADIDATETLNWDSGSGLRTIGTLSDSFTGVFDGGGFTISNLTIHRPTLDRTGLFGKVYGGTISDLNIENASVTGSNFTGILAGLARDASTVTRVSTSGTVTGMESVGGCVGKFFNSSTLSQCCSSADVFGDINIGGLVGEMLNLSTISNAYALGDIDAIIAIGGIVGSIANGTIEKCYAAGLISSDYPEFTGGVAGNSSLSTVTETYWDIDATGIATGTLGTGLTTTELQDFAYHYQNGNWDFAWETAHGTSDIWNMDGSTNSGYPWLTWQEIDPVAPEAPENPVLSLSGDGITLTWNIGTGPAMHNVYQSDSPYGPWEPVTTGTLDDYQWTDTLSGHKRWFHITADRPQQTRQATSTRNRR